MGWTWFHREPGRETIAETMQKEWGPGVEFLETAVVGMKTFYAACRSLDRETGLPRNGEVWAAVVLLNYAPHDQYNFGYKDMDETVGPCESDAPERILKLLTPTESQWANEWRARCWANIEKKKQDRKKAKALEVGTLVDFGRPLTFGSWGTFQRMFYAGGNVFHERYQGTTRYTVPKWKEYDWSIVTSATELSSISDQNQAAWALYHSLIDAIPERDAADRADVVSQIKAAQAEATRLSNILSDLDYRDRQHAESVTAVTA